MRADILECLFYAFDPITDPKFWAFPISHFETLNSDQDPFLFTLLYKKWKRTSIAPWDTSPNCAVWVRFMIPARENETVQCRALGVKTCSKSGKQTRTKVQTFQSMSGLFSWTPLSRPRRRRRRMLHTVRGQKRHNFSSSSRSILLVPLLDISILTSPLFRSFFFAPSSRWPTCQG